MEMPMLSILNWIHVSPVQLVPSAVECILLGWFQCPKILKRVLLARLGLETYPGWKTRAICPSFQSLWQCFRAEFSLTAWIGSRLVFPSTKRNGKITEYVYCRSTCAGFGGPQTLGPGTLRSVESTECPGGVLTVTWSYLRGFFVHLPNHPFKIIKRQLLAHRHSCGGMEREI